MTDIIRTEVANKIISRKTDYTFHSATQSVCNECRKLINAQRIIKNNKVYMRKFCPEHGHQEALISSHAEWFCSNYARTAPDYRPENFKTEVKNGCPYDCGLCPDHQHHTCKAVVELTDDCDLNCPVCLVGKKGNSYLTLKKCEEIFDNYVNLEGGGAEAITISCGEPTLHPDVLEVLKAAIKRKVNCFHLNTNGNKIAKDEAFVKELAKLEGNFYINLQFDGFSSEIWKSTRGTDLTNIKLKALEMLEKYNIKSQITMTVIKGVNEHQIERILRMCLEKDFIKSFNIQPIVYTGNAADRVIYDPFDHITMPDVILALEEQTNGLVKMSDWIVPCSPMCAASCYVYIDSRDKIVPVKGMLKEEEYHEIVKNRPDATWELQSYYHSSKKSVENNCCSNKILKPTKEITGKVMKIGIHAFMDSYTFDIERIMQCCIHCLTPDGKIMPWCAYNHFYRSKDPRYAEKFSQSGYNVTPKEHHSISAI
ncbi:MAG: radical SAM protein [Candidatus Firestonebacteria bacterium]|nr:radical SAM protein [Candidatus Firestonebacteria bacterium]